MGGRIKKRILRSSHILSKDLRSTEGPEKEIEKSCTEKESIQREEEG